MKIHSDNVLLPLVEAIERETGRRVHLSTALRWALRNSRGICLETKMLGGRRVCSQQMVRDFIEQKTLSANNRIDHSPRVSTPSARKESIRRANALLDAEGV
jgi:hypothetical protein